jgi:acyl-homoserine lactone acylase PvdQ
MKHSLVAVLVTLLSASVPGSVWSQLVLQSPDGTEVVVHRDEYGVPHLVAETEEGAFFGQGFVAGVDRIVQLEYGRRISEGRISEIPLLGDQLLDSDRSVLRDFYTEEERQHQFDELDTKFKIIYESYTAGVNRFLDSMEANPDQYRPAEIDLLESFGLVIEPWTVTNSVSVTQFMLRQFGQFGGLELERLAELQQNGQAWFDEHRPINDPDAPTTIPKGESNGTANPLKNPVFGSRPSSPFPFVDPSVIRSIRDGERSVKARRGHYGIPNTFGSFAVLVGTDRSSTGGALLLGAPQMTRPDSTTTSIVFEIEIQSPTLHIAGIGLAGIPGILIGRNEHHAWSMTSGISDNTDVFIETVEDTTFGRYLHNDEWLDFEVFTDTIKVGIQRVEFVHYRTIHGPVFGSDLPRKQVFSKQMTFWGSELDALTGFYKMWRANDIEEFAIGASLVPVSFNLFYADITDNTGFWHIGRYVDRSDSVDPRLPRIGEGAEEWIGLRRWVDQPQSVNPSQGYFVNWNNKPSESWDNGDNIPWALANELDTQRGVDRVLVIDEIVGSKPVMSFQDLTQVPSDMDNVCRNTSTGVPCYTRGTYEQMLSMTPVEQEAVNILPPGQTASPLITGIGEAGPHGNDQWGPFTAFEYKPMRFGSFSAVPAEKDAAEFLCAGTDGLCGVHLSAPYPNPAANTTVIRFGLDRPSDVTISIHDLLGRTETLRWKRQLASGSHQIEVNVSGMSAGVYFYRVETERAMANGSFVVAR